MLITVQFVLCIIIYCHFTSDENLSDVTVRNFQLKLLKISQLLKWALNCNRDGIYAWKVLTSAEGCVCVTDFSGSHIWCKQLVLMN